MKCPKILACLFLVILILGSYSYALGEDCSHYWLVEETPSANLGILYHKQSCHPSTLIVFFPGCGEYYSIENTKDWIDSNQIYDNIDAYVILVTSKKTAEENYLKSCDDALDYVASLYYEYEFDIIIDCVSMGGYEGTYFARKALERNIPIKEIVYADALGSRDKQQEDMLFLLLNGVSVTAYSSNDYDRSISINTREMIENYIDYNGFTGINTFVPHGKVLHEAIYTYGLHHDLIKWNY